MRSVLFLGLTASLLAVAADSPTRAQVLAERQARFPELMAIVELTHSVPPEFAAEALLRVAESPKLTDAAWKQELIRDAFEQAVHARMPMPVRLPQTPRTSRTRELLLAQSSLSGLDRLSLTMRAVRLEFSLNTKNAWTMFAAAGRPQPRPVTCAAALVDDDSAYFETAAMLFSRFSPGEQKAGQDTEFLLSVLRGITSASEIEPAARLIGSVHLRPEQQAAASAALAGALRSFRADESGEPPNEKSPDIAAGIASGLNESNDVLFAWRHKTADGINYLLTFTSNPEDLAAAWDEFQKQNTAARACRNDPQLTDILSEEDTGNIKRLFSEIVFGNGSQSLTGSQKNAAWQERFAELVRSIRELKQSGGEADLAFFVRKWAMYAVALTAAPPGAERNMLTESYCDFLKSSPLEQASPLEWFSQAVAIAKANRLNGPAEGIVLLQAFAKSGSPILMLFAAEESVLSQRPQWAR